MKVLLSILTCVVACTANADEPWMYPISISTSPTLADLTSATVKKSHAGESNGVRPLEGTTRVVDANVASSQEIVKWYSDQIGETQLPKFLERFVNGGNAGPGIGFFETRPMARSTHLTYRLTLKQKQITIRHAKDSGDVVAISLPGSEGETGIHVLRHRLSDQALSRNGGELGNAHKLRRRVE